MTNPWLRPEVAQQQRALVDKQLAEKPMPPHFLALADAVLATQCPGSIIEVGAASGYGREILDRAGLSYREYVGIDISPAAIAIAKERYPESTWIAAEFSIVFAEQPVADVVIDGCTLMHVDDWRAHLAALCRASRRHVILHRVPLSNEDNMEFATTRSQTCGYGQTFPAWKFWQDDIYGAMYDNGFADVSTHTADGDSKTLTFAKPRHWATYCDAAYLPRLKALHASMVRHCGPFVLHVLSWDEERDRMGDVERWCREQTNVEHMIAPLFLASHPELEIGKLPGPPRTRVEHMWTCGPQWIADVMKRTGEPVTYVDADVMFFSSPEPMFAEIGGAPAAVVPHGFAEASRGLPGPTRETHEVFGKFNVGIVYAADRAFVERWAKRCRESCYDKLTPVELSFPNANTMSMETFTSYDYADQSYLNEWVDTNPYGLTMGPRPRPKWASGIAHVIQHPGACAGPWQAHTRALDVRDGVIHYGNRPLIAYHFSGYREGPHGAESLSRPEYQISERQAELIYRPYIMALRETK